MLSTTVETLAVIHRNAEAFATNAAAVRAGAEDVEHVHQARVATRRLRAALRVFEELLPPEAEGLRDELRWIANQFSPVRDLDVQLARVQASADALQLIDALEPYTAWLHAERARALPPLCAALDSERFAVLLSSLNATGDWQLAFDSFDAGARIEAAMKGLRKAVGNTHDPPAPAELHRVRIRAKRARYTVEFFEPASPLRDRLVAVQDLLGAFQDTVVSRKWIVNTSPAWPVQTLMALGQLQRYEQEQADRAVRKFPKCYRDAEKMWRRFDASKLAIS
jgi:triphosphatase